MRKNKNRGSALLYSVMLIGALLAVAQLAFSLITFSILSRRQSYIDEVNYWLAWGGVEAALHKIDHYTPANVGSSLWLNWPQTALKGVTSDQNFKHLVFTDNRSYYQKGMGSYEANFKNALSISYYDSTFPKNYSLKKDESLLFDVSSYKGELNINFTPKGESDSEREKSLMWFRAEDTDSGELVEGLVRFRLIGGLPQLESLGELFGSSTHQLQLRDKRCSLGSKGYQCSFALRDLSHFRLLKIKSFNSTAQLFFLSSSGDKLGTPETLIVSQGCLMSSCRSLYVEFPNRLKSVSDVLDYSIYQAEF